MSGPTNPQVRVRLESAARYVGIAKGIAADVQTRSFAYGLLPEHLQEVVEACEHLEEARHRLAKVVAGLGRGKR